MKQKRFFKKTLSLVLAFLLVVGCVPLVSLNMKADAVTISRLETQSYSQYHSYNHERENSYINATEGLDYYLDYYVYGVNYCTGFSYPVIKNYSEDDYNNKKFGISVGDIVLNATAYKDYRDGVTYTPGSFRIHDGYARY